MDDLPTRAQLEKSFAETGERERLRELLIQRLRESGWNKQVICSTVRAVSHARVNA